jgi:hypothetical protein
MTMMHFTGVSTMVQRWDDRAANQGRESACAHLSAMPYGCTRTFPSDLIAVRDTYHFLLFPPSYLCQLVPLGVNFDNNI